ncbi:MAG: glycosyltransferase family 39 protein, partial [Acidobacteriota bacterium]|nr:glycosyltransferase family 39 protein [Acidobacteriota bacterium]
MILLALAFGLRLFFIFVVPPSNSAKGDPRYTITAANILSGNGISMETNSPYRPSAACVPLYPLFMAAVFATVGQSPAAVKVTQAVIDLLTCLLLAYVSFQLAPAAYKNNAALAALALYGLVSWFTLVWTTCLLTETLALFFTMLTVALCALALRRGGWRYWAGAGLSCGLALSTRPDSVLLLCAVLLFLVWRLALRRSRADVIGVLGFGLAVILTLTPWTLRNYLSLGIFQPLASEYGFADGDGEMPLGYLLWLRTWITDETYFGLVFEPVFPPTRGVFYEVSRLPVEAFASDDERRRVSALLARYNQTRVFTPALDEEFRSLAYERI